MRRGIVLIIMAFLIAGGTVGILHQEGIGGMAGANKATEEEPAPDPMLSAQIPSNVNLSNEETQEVTDETAEGEPAENTEEVSEEDAAIAEAEAEEAAAAEALAEEEARKAEEEAKAAEEARAAKEAGAPYYSVTVTGAQQVNIYDVATDGKAIGTVDEGATGYLLDDNGNGNRRLVYLDGKIVYITKLYTTTAEISTDEFPDDLVGVGVEAVGYGLDQSSEAAPEATETTEETAETPAEQ